MSAKPAIGHPFIIKAHMQRVNGRLHFHDTTGTVQGDLRDAPEVVEWVRRQLPDAPVVYLWARREHDGSIGVYMTKLPKQSPAVFKAFTCELESA